MFNLKPVGITADRQDQTVSIRWSDGHTSVYPFGLLRNACPCAECAGGHDNMRSEPDPGVFDLPIIDPRKNQLRNLTGVGNYAINIHWEDGHQFGIYNWSYLRALCPCPDCREARSQPG